MFQIGDRRWLNADFLQPDESETILKLDESGISNPKSRNF